MVSFWLPKIISTIFYILFITLTVFLFTIVIPSPTVEGIGGLVCALLFVLGWTVFFIRDVINIKTYFQNK